MPEYPPRGVSPGPLGSDARGGGGGNSGGGPRLGSGVPRGPYGNPNHANHSDQDLLVPNFDRRSPSGGSNESYEIRVVPPVGVQRSILSFFIHHLFSLFFSSQIYMRTETDLRLFSSLVHLPFWIHRNRCQNHQTTF
jgi:hypothetical protein